MLKANQFPQQSLFTHSLFGVFFSILTKHTEKKSPAYIMPATVQDGSRVRLLSPWNSLPIFFDFPTSNLQKIKHKVSNTNFITTTLIAGHKLD